MDEEGDENEIVYHARKRQGEVHRVERVEPQDDGGGPEPDRPALMPQSKPEQAQVARDQSPEPEQSNHGRALPRADGAYDEDHTRRIKLCLDHGRAAKLRTQGFWGDTKTNAENSHGGSHSSACRHTPDCTLPACVAGRVRCAELPRSA